MTRNVVASLALVVHPATAAVLDVRPDPVSAVSSPLGGVVLAVAALIAGIWYVRRRRGR